MGIQLFPGENYSQEIKAGAIIMIQDKMITSIFSSIVKHHPDGKAVIHNKKSLTYKQLDLAAACLACRLKMKQTKPCMIIALYLPSGIEAIVSMLGVLKAGHAYLPLDINDPLSRTEEILDGSEPDIIITSHSHKFYFKNRDIIILISDDLMDSSDLIKNKSKEPLYKDLGVGKISPDSLAYIIYTSGSTGKPKGIPIKHQAVINLLDDFQQRSSLNHNDNCSLWTNLNFDVSVYEIWSALLSGASLFIPDSQIRTDAGKFIQWLRRFDITSAYIPPFMVADLAKNQLTEPLSFKRILTGVEPIPETLLCTIKRSTPGLCLINGYGPAEATVCATLYDVPDYPDNPGNAPIGKPVNNLKVYLLDESKNHVKNGEKGEIYIAGIQVADGYFKNNALSEKNFLNNPFSNDLPKVMYKTGDMGIRLKNGNIMFGGRKDFQIKLRGFRIEPGEIENVIKEFPGISQTAVVLKENKTQRKILTAYIDANPDQEKLIEFLKSKLPKYMLPSAVISLKKMPLTSQDKIDKRNLIQREDLEILDQELPRTVAEKKMAGIWEKFFNISPIYRNDDFLLLGGDSISGVKILSRLNRLFSKDIQISTLFEHSLLKDFSTFFTADKDKETNIGILEITPTVTIITDPTEDTPLLEDQNLIWIFEQINPDTSLYHIPLVYKVTGKLDHDLLKQSIEIIKKRHISLQSQFLIKDDLTIQKQEKNVNDDHDKPIHFKIDRIEDRLNLKNKWILDKTQEKFNLETGPVFKTDLLITGDSACIICFTFHHIIFDGWSAGLFVKELSKTYTSLVKGEAAKLLDLKFSYHNYVSTKTAEVDHEWETARAFFTSYLKNLPRNDNRTSQDLSGACFPVKIDIEVYNKIKEIALENRTSSFTILLALFQILLFAETGESDQITGIAYAGRDKIETEPLIGFLMNTLVIRNFINTDHSLSSFLSSVKENLATIFKYKNIPFQNINRLC
jgi:amino acid adenylation domain-containing protein